MNTADFLLRADLADLSTHARPALISNAGQMTTYAELQALAAGVLERLLQAELPFGSRVGILAHNSPFWVACYLAILKYGGVAVPFPATLTAAELEARLAQAQVSALCLDARTLGKLRGGLRDVTLITEAQIAPSRWPAPSNLDPAPDLDRDAALMFTSGSTAQPRLVRVSHRNIQANTQSILGYIDINADDRMWSVLPLHYCFGTSLLHTYLRAGASLVLCNTFAFPEVALKTLEATGCTGLAGVPSVFQTLLRNSSFPTRLWPKLRHIQQAGGKLAEPLLRELIEVTAQAAPQARIFTMYGQTEATARLSYLPPEMLPTKLGSIGKGIPGVRLQVLNEAGAPVAPGAVGEIVARGDNITSGYLDDPALTAQKFVDGALRTGDLATVDAEGFIYIVDRANDFIKSYGHRVSSQEIEACAMSIPGIVTAAAIGETDPTRGEAIRLFLVLAKNAPAKPAERDIAGYFAQHLARYKRPRDIIFLDQMPTNANGKIAKNLLRRPPLGMPSPSATSTAAPVAA